MVKIGFFEEIGAQIGRLVDDKHRNYGQSFEKTGDILRILYPVSIQPHQYGDILAIARILDKFFRQATSARAYDEDPWMDIAGYSLLMNAKLDPTGYSPPTCRHFREGQED